MGNCWQKMRTQHFLAAHGFSRACNSFSSPNHLHPISSCTICVIYFFLISHMRKRWSNAYRQEREGHIRWWFVSQSYKAGTNDFHCAYRSSRTFLMSSSSMASSQKTEENKSINKFKKGKISIPSNALNGRKNTKISYTKCSAEPQLLNIKPNM